MRSGESKATVTPIFAATTVKYDFVGGNFKAYLNYHKAASVRSLNKVANCLICGTI